jgi:hypothetical protein
LLGHCCEIWQFERHFLGFRKEEFYWPKVVDNGADELKRLTSVGADWVNFIIICSSKLKIWIFLTLMLEMFSDPLWKPFMILHDPIIFRPLCLSPSIKLKNIQWRMEYKIIKTRRKKYVQWFRQSVLDKDL